MFAERLSRIALSPGMRVVQTTQRMQRDGVDVVDLAVGEPDGATPSHVAAAGIEAIEDGFTRYTANAGLLELREAIAARYRSDYGVDYASDEVIVSTGGKQALLNAVLALFGPGDDVVVHAPGWPTIPEQVRLADATPVVVRTFADEEFALRADRLLAAVTPRTRGFIVNSPCNPTGSVMDEQEFARLASGAAERDCWVLVDLCYEHFLYDGTAHRLPRIAAERARDRTILVGSASKSYAMTGWRCGWALGPREAIAACNVIQSHSTSNASSISQRAALAAVAGPQEVVGRMRETYQRRRDLVLGWLRRDPRLEVVVPRGAFYLFIDVGALLSLEGPRTSLEFVDRLLERHHVALMAGEAFDAPGFVRLSFAAADDRLEEGVRRLLAMATEVAGPPSGHGA